MNLNKHHSSIWQGWTSFINQKQIFRRYYHHFHSTSRSITISRRRHQINQGQRVSSTILSGTHLIAFRVTFAVSNTISIFIGLRFFGSAHSMEKSPSDGQRHVLCGDSNTNPEEFLPSSDISISPNRHDDELTLNQKSISSLPHRRKRILWNKPALPNQQDRLPIVGFRSQLANISMKLHDDYKRCIDKVEMQQINTVEYESATTYIVQWAKTGTTNFSDEAVCRRLFLHAISHLMDQRDISNIEAILFSPHIPSQFFTPELLKCLINNEACSLANSNSKLLGAVFSRSFSLKHSDNQNENEIENNAVRILEFLAGRAELDVALKDVLEQSVISLHASRAAGICIHLLELDDSKTFHFFMQLICKRDRLQVLDILIRIVLGTTYHERIRLLQWIKPNSEQLTKDLIICLGSDGYISEMLDIFEHVLIQSHVSDDNRLLVRCIKLTLDYASTENNERLLRTLESYPQSIRVMFSLWMTQAATHRGLYGLEQVINRFSRTSVEPDTVNFNDMMIWYSRFARYKRVLEVYHELLTKQKTPSISTFTILLQLPRSFLSSEHIDRILDDIQRYGLKLDAPFATSFIAKCILLRNDHAIIRIINQIHSDPCFVPDLLLLQTIFSWAMKSRNRKLICRMIFYKSNNYRIRS